MPGFFFFYFCYIEIAGRHIPASLSSLFKLASAGFLFAEMKPLPEALQSI
jgi:hypothetical protein